MVIALKRLLNATKNILSAVV